MSEQTGMVIGWERVIQTVVGGVILYYIMGVNDQLTQVTRKVDVLSERVAISTQDRYSAIQAASDFALRDQRINRNRDEQSRLELRLERIERAALPDNESHRTN